jgi:hypothetical protein
MLYPGVASSANLLLHSDASNVDGHPGQSVLPGTCLQNSCAMNQILSQYLIDSKDTRSSIKVATLVDPSSSPAMAWFHFFFHIRFKLYHSIQEKVYAQCNHFRMFCTFNCRLHKSCKHDNHNIRIIPSALPHSMGRNCGC